MTTDPNSNRIFYRSTGGLYWKVFTNFAPAFRVNGVEGNSSREVSFCVSQNSYLLPAVAILSSGLFWWWYTISSNLRDLNPSDIQGFPVPSSAIESAEMKELGRRYIRDIKAKSSMLVREQRSTGRTETQSFKIQKSKNILDEIDRALGKEYGLSDEEIDFIINYDIKFRMGAEEEENTEGGA